MEKTGLIKELFDGYGKVSLFTCPRRFGKIINISMLRYFFEIGTDRSLFDGLAISREKELCDRHMGQYPVISISLKDIDGLDFASASEGLRDLISELTNRLDYLFDSGKINASEKRQLAMLQDGEGRIESSLKFLSRLPYKHYGKKRVILIDEYDVPLERAAQNGFYKEMVALIRQIFGSALKTNDYLQFAVLTGCLRVLKESVFTGLNNFRVHSITDAHFDEWFGFSEQEVGELLRYYGLEEYHDEIYERQVLAWFESKAKTAGRDRIEFYHAFETGDVSLIEEALDEILLNSISYYDEYESFYHSFLLALLSACEHWQAISNREMGKGRSDISVERKDRTLGFIVELKYAREESGLEEASKAALQQIEANQYAAQLIHNRTPDIWIYGIAFCGRRWPGICFRDIYSRTIKFANISYIFLLTNAMIKHIV